MIMRTLPVRIIHLSFAIAAAMLAILLNVEEACAQTPAETFVEQNIQRGLQILNNHSISETQRREQFRDFLTGLTDIRRIALFTLGAARRTAAPQQIDAFVDAFRDYAVAVYESRLGQYAGQTLRVTGSTPVGSGDEVVSTILVDPSGKTAGQEPVKVDFRVLSDNGRFVVIDVSIVGVWLALEERDQFTAFLQQNNGDIGALTHHLDELTAKLRNGGGTTNH